jgi:hypothetical protein
MLSWLGVGAGHVFALSGRLSPMPALIVWSVLCGFLILWVFRLASRPEAIRKAKRRLYGLLLEMWLHGDEPALVWRAQRDLVFANAKYLGLMLAPVLILTPPLALMWGHLDQLFGLAPLMPGRTAIVTAQFRDAQELQAVSPQITMPKGFVSETPPLRALSDGQVAWRIRATTEADGNLQIGLPGSTLEKRIVAGGRFRYLTARRGSSALDVLEHPGEAVLPAGPVEWIEVGYPATRHRLFGTEWPWEVWFLVLSSVVALAFRKKFGVTF